MALLPLDPAFVEARDRGVSPEEIVALMRRRGLSIVQACAAFTKLYGVGLGQAKVAVTSHPAYRDVAQAAEPLHDAIVSYFQFEGSHAGDIREQSPLKLKLVWIPPGDFTMGSLPDDKDRCGDASAVGNASQATSG